MAFEDLDAGDESRHHGDRIGFPHPVSDGTSLDSASLDEGVIVTYGGDDIAEVTGDDSDDVAGVLFTLPVDGDSSRAGPYVRGDRDATVGVRGSYIADLGAYVTSTDTTVAEGNALGPNGEVYVKEVVDAGNNIYEVILR